MGYPKRLRAKLKYEEEKEAANVQFGRGTGSAGSADPYPKPAMTCLAAAPMGIYGLILASCKGVEETINRGDETDAPPSDEENIEFPDYEEYGIDSWEPVSHSSGVGEGCPAMPVIVRPAQEHRDKIPIVQAPFNVAVARSVGKKEMYSNPLALKAVREEWDRLRKKQCWSEDAKSVREWKHVAAEARNSETTVHIGRLCCICVEKGSELKADDKRRKFKGRVVFLGNNVKDQNWDYAVFQELSSCPATMEGSRSADCYGCIPGNNVMQADAEQAYIQAKLEGTPTWVEIPREEWPDEWVKRGMIRPVCPLHLALYGHPDSGGHWEAHCEAHLASVGFVRIPDWHSTFWHPEHKLFLVVYVDDFKLSGPEEKLQVGWNLISQGITLEKPEPIGLYLGCKHIQTKGTLPDGTPFNMMTYDMEEFLKSCVDLYVSLAPSHFKIKTALTPFPPDSKDHGLAGNPHSKDCEVIHCPWCRDSFPAELNVPRVRATKKGNPTTSADAPGGCGVLQPYAAKVLMKLLYGARLARFDLLRAINNLAGYITKWTPECDKRLHRIMCYVHTSLHYRMVGWVGDKADQLQPHLFADADFAGCPESQRSTSGLHLAIRGPATCFPIAGASKRQTCVAFSTPEAELSAAAFALRMAGLPGLQLWDTLFERAVVLLFHEDNQAMIRVCLTGRNPTMRYLERTQRVVVASLYEYFCLACIELVYEATHRQCADIYTKAFPEASKWYAVLLLVNVCDGRKLEQLLTSFTVHNYEREQEEILSHFKDLEPTKKRTPHDLYAYVAAPSTVQRRGGTTKAAPSVKQGGDTKTVTQKTPHLEQGGVTDMTEDNFCDDLNLRFDDLPLPYGEEREEKPPTPREQGGDSDGSHTSSGRPPLAPSVLHTTRVDGLKTTAKHGDKLYELDPKSSIAILKLLENYDWPQDDITDIGLTLEKGLPRLGVLTQRHLQLAMNLNYHMQHQLKGYRWSTISVDARMHVNEERKWQQRKLSALLTMGCYTGGEVYSTDGSLQIGSTDVDTVYANTKQYISLPSKGKRYVIQLHNESYTDKVLPEDRRLLRSVGFVLDGKVPYEWRHVAWHHGPCPLQLVPTFYKMLFIELCCGETSELCKLEHTTPTVLGIRVTLRHDILSKRTLEMLRHCVAELGFGTRLVVWMSFRCTGGSQMQHINEFKAHQTQNLATLQKINDARWEFSNHFRASQPLVRSVRGLGGHIALELPRHCSYWSQPLLTQFISDYKLLSAEFDGCMYGLIAKYGDSAGQLMLKHWKLVTTSTDVASSITMCCNHDVPHVRIEGRNTKSSENYPPLLAKSVITAFRKSTKIHTIAACLRIRTIPTISHTCSHSLFKRRSGSNVVGAVASVASAEALGMQNSRGTPSASTSGWLGPPPQEQLTSVPLGFPEIGSVTTAVRAPSMPRWPKVGAGKTRSASPSRVPQIAPELNSFSSGDFLEPDSPPPPPSGPPPGYPKETVGGEGPASVKTEQSPANDERPFSTREGGGNHEVPSPSTGAGEGKHDQTPHDHLCDWMASALPHLVCKGDQRAGGDANGHNHDRFLPELVVGGPNDASRCDLRYGTSRIQTIWRPEWGEPVPNHMQTPCMAWNQRLRNMCAASMSFLKPGEDDGQFGSLDPLAGLRLLEEIDDSNAVPEYMRLDPQVHFDLLTDETHTCWPPPIPTTANGNIHIFTDSTFHSYPASAGKERIPLNDIVKVLGYVDVYSHVDLTVYKGATLTEVLTWLTNLADDIDDALLKGGSVTKADSTVIVIWQGNEWTTYLKAWEGCCREICNHDLENAHAVAELLSQFGCGYISAVLPAWRWKINSEQYDFNAAAVAEVFSDYRVFTLGLELYASLVLPYVRLLEKWGRGEGACDFQHSRHVPNTPDMALIQDRFVRTLLNFMYQRVYQTDVPGHPNLSFKMSVDEIDTRPAAQRKAAGLQQKAQPDTAGPLREEAVTVKKTSPPSLEQAEAKGSSSAPPLYEQAAGHGSSVVRRCGRCTGPLDEEAIAAKAFSCTACTTKDLPNPAPKEEDGEGEIKKGDNNTDIRERLDSVPPHSPIFTSEGSSYVQRGKGPKELMKLIQGRAQGQDQDWRGECPNGQRIMTLDPDHNSNWNQLPTCIPAMLPPRLDLLRCRIFDLMRHTATGDQYGLSMNNGGWLRAEDVASAAGCNMAELVWVVYVTTPAMQGGRLVFIQSGMFATHNIDWVRATTGHTVALDWSRLTSPLRKSMAEEVSVICHTTSSANLQSILHFGLLPSGGGKAAQPVDPKVLRRMPNSSLSTYALSDRRMSSDGRSKSDSYVTIFFQRIALLEEVPVLMCADGTLRVCEALPPRLISKIILGSGIRSATTRVLYDMDFVGKDICGIGNRASGPAVLGQHFSGASPAPDPQHVKTCTNIHCKVNHASGLMECLSCGVRFLFKSEPPHNASASSETHESGMAQPEPEASDAGGAAHGPAGESPHADTPHAAADPASHSDEIAVMLAQMIKWFGHAFSRFRARAPRRTPLLH